MFFQSRGKVPHSVRPEAHQPPAPLPKEPATVAETPTTLKELEVLELKEKFVTAFEGVCAAKSFCVVSQPVPTFGYEVTVSKLGESKNLLTLTIRTSNFMNRLSWKFDDGSLEGQEQGDLANTWDPAAWASRVDEVVLLLTELLQKVR